jgi:hypothetical protein
MTTSGTYGFDLALNLASVWLLCLAAFLSLAERAPVREGW